MSDKDFVPCGGCDGRGCVHCDFSGEELEFFDDSE